MSSDTLTNRCDELGGILLELTPLLIESLGNSRRLIAVNELLVRLRAVLDKGADGITDVSYLRWLAEAGANIDTMQRAATAGDANAAWDAFTDRARGVNLLSSACAGRPGW